MYKLTQNSLRGAALRLEIKEGDIARNNRMKAKRTRLEHTGLSWPGKPWADAEGSGKQWLAQALAGSPVMGV